MNKYFKAQEDIRQNRLFKKKSRHKKIQGTGRYKVQKVQKSTGTRYKKEDSGYKKMIQGTGRYKVQKVQKKNQGTGDSLQVQGTRQKKIQGTRR
ncbi:hypothetical protein CEXT_655911 [Caerostris extrusa]|uniref:Uncharacterized protein n=1 Tax=Caerostris extrusa TaxID=172846 RepID=A0AAV4QT79_CAEEX|nr:hypothetical protein CEXT_655911 [Caerostris extrusa]